jgi:hypothetical protein
MMSKSKASLLLAGVCAGLKNETSVSKISLIDCAPRSVGFISIASFQIAASEWVSALDAYW